MRIGALLCLASAVAFGAMGIFGKLAYEQGATVGTLLAVRFVLAAALFWGLVLATGAGRRLRTLPRRDIGLALGRHGARDGEAVRGRLGQQREHGPLPGRQVVAGAWHATPT
jgi:hypothetical protein